MASKTAPSGRKILYWHDPMHPAYKSDKPGVAPDCGMQLEPVYEGSGPTASPSATVPPGSVQIQSDRQQMIGLRLAEVARTAEVRMLRTTGRVAADETRTYVINATVDGWITDVRPYSTGSSVRKNDVLASFYSPEFLSTIQAYLLALSALDRVQAAAQEDAGSRTQLDQYNLNVQRYRSTLFNQGMTDLQLDELGRSRKLTEHIYITSPANGFILVRRISEGLRFFKGEELYRIADLSRVWILVDVFGQEERFLKPGEQVQVRLPNHGARIYARVSNVLPQFDPTSQALKVRLESENPGFRLRPDMFVDVEIAAQYPATITVPYDAVVDTGLRKTVFVDRGNGYFEPRRVETGWRMGDRVEIIRGLMEGERIVVSGNFLVDSESRLRLAAAGLPEDYVLDPVCGMGVDPKKAGDKKSTYKGQTYYFCNPDCKAKFEAGPAKYVSQNSVLRIQNSESKMQKAEGGGKGQAGGKLARDLVCGMDVDTTASGVLKADYQDKTYYFCNPSCKESFLNNPAKYVSK
jgi:RND family efflux transporter MFP subunit